MRREDAIESPARPATTPLSDPSTTRPSRRRDAPARRHPEPRCLGYLGTTPNGAPMYAMRRPDGQIVTVVIPNDEE